MFHFNSSIKRFVYLGGGSLLALACLALPLASAESEVSGSAPVVRTSGMDHQSPAWAERLKGQTIVENAQEGRAERAALVEKQHERLMQQMQKEMTESNSGGYNTMSMMHQYGAGKGNYLLASDGDLEPVAMTGGGKCPASAPVKQYDVLPRSTWKSR